MTLEGFATKEGTRAYLDKYKDYQYNTLGKTGLSVSQIGFGGYRIDVRSPLNLEALKKALISGINLVDTSANYTDGNSELLIGDVLKDLIESNKVSRESMVVVTKGGYIQGENYELSQERKEDGYPYPELIEFSEGLEHCIHPEFLNEQITMSLERLGLDTADVYLLHNPEYYLKWAEKNGKDKETARKTYYSRIKKAFEYLEEEVDKGRIKYYGISSNTFVSNKDDFDFTSLEKVISIAEEISPQNHFRIVEFPLNIMEKSAVTEKNQSGDKTVIQLAEENNLGVLINRPLNAISEGKLTRLAEPIVHQAPTEEAINQELENILALEKKIADKLKKIADKETVAEISDNLFIYEELKDKWQMPKDIFGWDAALKQYYLPRFHNAKNIIKNSGIKDEELDMDLFGCTFKIGKLFSTISSYWNNEYLKYTGKMKEDLISQLPELEQLNKISNMAIYFLRSTKGISSVLVGMVQIPYVNDALQGLKIPANKEFNIEEISL